MPARVIAVIVIVFLQVVINAFGGVFILDSVSTDLAHGRRVGQAGLLNFVGYFSLIVALALLVGNILLIRRRQLGSSTIVVVEVLGIISGLIGLVAAQAPSSLVGVVIGAAVVAVLLSKNTRDWLDRVPTAG